MHNLNCGKEAPKPVILKKNMLKVNNHPMGENSPNLVTLIRFDATDSKPHDS
jgi:hypothetical protein